MWLVYPFLRIVYRWKRHVFQPDKAVKQLEYIKQCQVISPRVPPSDQSFG